MKKVEQKKAAPSFWLTAALTLILLSVLQLCSEAQAQELTEAAKFRSFVYSRADGTYEGNTAYVIAYNMQHGTSYHTMWELYCSTVGSVNCAPKNMNVNSPVQMPSPVEVHTVIPDSCWALPDTSIWIDCDTLSYEFVGAPVCDSTTSQVDSIAVDTLCTTEPVKRLIAGDTLYHYGDGRFRIKRSRATISTTDEEDQMVFHIKGKYYIYDPLPLTKEERRSLRQSVQTWKVESNFSGPNPRKAATRAGRRANSRNTGQVVVEFVVNLFTLRWSKLDFTLCK